MKDLSENQLKQQLANRTQVLFEVKNDVATIIYIKLPNGYVEISLSSSYPNNFLLEAFEGEWGLNRDITNVLDKGQSNKEIVEELKKAKQHTANDPNTIDRIIALFQ